MTVNYYKTVVIQHVRKKQKLLSDLDKFISCAFQSERFFFVYHIIKVKLFEKNPGTIVSV